MQPVATETSIGVFHIMKIIQSLSAVPREDRVLYRMGFKPGKAEIPESMQPMVNQAMQTGLKLLEPKACYDLRGLRLLERGHLVIEPDFHIQCAKLYDWMAGCTEVYLLAVTIGPALDEEVRRLSETDNLTGAFLLNAYGAEAAEALIESLNDRIVKLAELDGKTTTKRYSPGYGEWDISDQKTLLNLLEADKIGILLTPQFLMLPEKSVSAIAGVKVR